MLSEPAGLPFAKLRLERCGEDAASLGSGLPARFESPSPRFKVAIFQEEHMENPTAEPKFGSLTPTQTVTNYHGKTLPGWRWSRQFHSKEQS